MSGTGELRLAVALEATGWHPAAWREPDARATEIFGAKYWQELVAEAEDAQLDFVTFEDGFGLPEGEQERVHGRIDSVQLAARIAPRTSRIGLIPTVVATHTEPFHVSKAIATLDYVSKGRAGVRIRVDREHFEYFGRREPPNPAETFEEAGDYVEVIRRLWDSWEDDAEIRDVATGRFIDRDKLHYIDFAGKWFSVKGPSITQRPPQGQPLVAALSHRDPVHEFAREHADLVFTTPADPDAAAELSGRFLETKVFADLLVFLDESEQQATRRKERLDAIAGAELRSDAAIFVGTAEQLAERLRDWSAAGISGIRLRPGALPHDLHAITHSLIPRLREIGLVSARHSSGAVSLRGTLGLDRPDNRYASSGVQHG